MFIRMSLRLIIKYLLLISILIIFFNEYLIYIIYRHLHWHQIPCISGNCSRILFVADPQILGETFDRNVYSNLAIIDVDRYLRNTFKNAYKHVKPNSICFMGDLMDEGSVATSPQYNRYLKRFNDIYEIDSNDNNKVEKIYIPGDNDIGGERGDIVTDSKVLRFKNAFMERDIIETNYVNFFNVNRLTHKYPESSNQLINNNRINIVLTHISLISYPGLFMDQVIKTLNPHVIFSAHMHVSRILTYPPLRLTDFIKNSIISFDLMDDRRRPNLYYSKQMLMVAEQHPNKDYRPEILEIMIPTCSYRMGFFKIGFGMAVIDNNHLKYTVLWLPNRFIFLIIYLIWSILMVLILFVWKCLSLKNSLIGNYRYRRTANNANKTNKHVLMPTKV